jgi:dienelactone hydrolase
MDPVREEIRLSTGTPATLVQPAGDGPWPGVVMIHEVFGVDDVLLRQADRLAAAGYLVLAPDLLRAAGCDASGRRCGPSPPVRAGPSS